MSGILLEIEFKNPNEGEDSEREVLLYGNLKGDLDKQKLALSKYQGITKYMNYGMVFRGCVPVNSLVDSGLGIREIEWPVLEERVWIQRKNRPRGQGCIFKFSSPSEEPEINTESYLKEIEEFLHWEIESELEKNLGEMYLFIGALWDSDSRRRLDTPVIIEAPSMRAAAAISDLYFTRQANQTTLTDWCPPIYDSTSIT